MHLAILVDDEREVGLALEESIELFRHPPLSGTNQGSIMSQLLDVELEGSQFAPPDRDQQVLRVQDSDDVFRLVLARQEAGCIGGQHLTHQLVRRRVALSVCIFVRWTMTSSTLRSNRSRTPPSIAASSRVTIPSIC